MKATTTPRHPLGFEPTTARRNGCKRQRYPDGNDCGGGDPLVQPEGAPEPQRVEPDSATYYEGPRGWMVVRRGVGVRVGDAKAIARDWVFAEASKLPGFCGAYFIGSIN